MSLSFPCVIRRVLKWPSVFVLALLTFPLVAPRAQDEIASKTTSSLSGNHDNGKRLFVSDGCYECHGILGQGATTGPRLAPNPIPAEAIRAYIRKPSGRMPPFSAKLVPDQDVADIYAYLKSVPGPADLKSIPLFAK